MVTHHFLENGAKLGAKSLKTFWVNRLPSDRYHRGDDAPGAVDVMFQHLGWRLIREYMC